MWNLSLNFWWAISLSILFLSFLSLGFLFLTNCHFQIIRNPNNQPETSSILVSSIICKDRPDLWASRHAGGNNLFFTFIGPRIYWWNLWANNLKKLSWRYPVKSSLVWFIRQPIIWRSLAVTFHTNILQVRAILFIHICYSRRFHLLIIIIFVSYSFQLYDL